MQASAYNNTVILITGASSGFGRLTAELLSSEASRFRVYGTSRNPASVDSKNYLMLELNVDSDDSVKKCIDSLLEREKKIDAVVNSAGNAFTGAAEETTIDEIKSHFETNFFGTIRVNDAVLPSMRRRKTGKIINIGSMASMFPVPFEGYYAAGKAALLAYTQALRHEVKQFNIKASIIQPGFFKTNLGASRGRRKNSIDDYRDSEVRALRKLEESFEKGGDPIVVAKKIVEVIKNPEPNLRYLVGKESGYAMLAKFLPSRTIENQIRKRFGLD